VSFTDATFTAAAPEGDEIPGAVETVVSAGAAIDLPVGAFGSVRVRHFGPRSLVEDGSVRSDSTTLVNLGAGYRWRDLTFELDVLNVLDSRDHDIDYFYASRLPGEPEEGVEDLHFHPVEPLALRGYVTWRF
jgi:hypothetical protein